jgi:hypothetical protein
MPKLTNSFLLNSRCQYSARETGHTQRNRSIPYPRNPSPDFVPLCTVEILDHSDSSICDKKNKRDVDDEKYPNRRRTEKNREGRRKIDGNWEIFSILQCTKKKIRNGDELNDFGKSDVPWHMSFSVVAGRSQKPRWRVSDCHLYERKDARP